MSARRTAPSSRGARCRTGVSRGCPSASRHPKRRAAFAHQHTHRRRQRVEDLGRGAGGRAGRRPAGRPRTRPARRRRLPICHRASSPRVPARRTARRARTRRRRAGPRDTSRSGGRARPAALRRPRPMAVEHAARRPAGSPASSPRPRGAPAASPGRRRRCRPTIAFMTLKLARSTTPAWMPSRGRQASVLRHDVAPGHDGGHRQPSPASAGDRVGDQRLVDGKRRGLPQLPAHQLVEFLPRAPGTWSKCSSETLARRCRARPAPRGASPRGRRARAPRRDGASDRRRPRRCSTPVSAGTTAPSGSASDA